MWIGNGANAEEKKRSLETSIDYVKADTSGRKVEDTIFITVRQGFEPPNFTGHFFAWDPKKWSDGQSYEDMKKALTSGEELTSSVAADLAKFSVSAKFTFAQLSAAVLPEGVDASQKEQYLADDEFKQVLGISRAEFNALPGWKKANARKKSGLF